MKPLTEQQKREHHRRLLIAATALGLLETGRLCFFNYEGVEIDLTASAYDPLSIMKNVAKQLAQEVKEIRVF